MTARLSIVDTHTGTEIRVEIDGRRYVRHFRLRESAFASVVTDQYVPRMFGPAQSQALFTAHGMEIQTSIELLLRQGFVREEETNELSNLPN